ncbi:MAG: glycoside hydrolase family 3 C-terminal domain-containing protein [Agathobacter sp.]|nr:glycoside hydrolase family 3 C-terminal domain-containing protein [Agathobacter sp.]
MKKDKKKTGIGKWIVTSVISIVLIIAMIVANIMTIAYEGVINMALKTETTTIQADPNDKTDTDYFKSAYASVDEVRKAGMDIAEMLTEEGAVLLKNENNSLPIDSSAKVSVFGHSSVNEIVCGTGSADIDASKAPSFKEALEEVGVKVNPSLWDFYASEEILTKYETNPKKGDNSIRNGADGVTKGAFTVNEVPWSEFTDAAKSEFDAYKDAAIVVFSRLGGEMWDLPSDVYKETGEITPGTGLGVNKQQGNAEETVNGSGNSLELTIQERDLLKQIKAAGFENVIVLLNCTNPIECDFVDDPELGVDSVMWIGFTGVNGLRGVADLLTNTDGTNPSGRVVDTFCIDNTTNPAMENFYGAFWNNSTDYTDMEGDGPGLDGNKYYNVYQEGIYVGYRYYETRYEDFVLGQGNAGNYNYATDVKYPFGYGLSYTTFEYSDFAVKENADSFDVTVKVTNTGDYAGKEVVEVYFQSPYTQYDKDNGIEKAAIELCGFAKTDVIEKGASETVTINVPKKELRAYDAKTAKTYILDAGDYYFTVGRDAHDALNNVLAAKGADASKMVAVGNAGYASTGNTTFVYKWNNPTLDTTTFATSTESGEEYAITNQLDTADINWLKENGFTDQTITYLSRNDWTNTWPNGTYIMNLSQKLHDEITGLKKYVKTETDAKVPTMGAKGDMTIAQMIGKDYNDPAWEDLLDQVTYEEMCLLIGVGYHGTYAVESIAKPKTIDENGPQGFTMKLTDVMGTSDTMTAYSDENIMAATWNTEFMYKVGESIGEDGLALKMAGLYGPAMNTHRTAYAGRNFEYYSEDGFLGGKIAAAEVGGIQSKGVYVYVKHFAFNDQETNTRCYSIFANEQAMREVYLEPFEHAIIERTMEVDGKEVAIGGAMNVMNSFGRVGVVWTGAHEGLMTNILRGEWGMDGFALTDYSNNGNTYDIFLGIMGGTDSWDNSNAGPMTRVDKLKRYDISQDPALAIRMREATHRILYTVANSSAMNGIAPSSRIVTVIPWWRALIYGVGVVSVLGLAASIFMIVKTKKKANA